MNYPVSVEFAFIDFAQYYENYDKFILDNFTSVQANTIIFSYLVYFFDRIFLIHNYQITGRLLSILSYLFIYFGAVNFINYFKIQSKNFFILIFLLLLNPIIWIYGFKATSDLLPSSISFFAISIIFIKKNIIYKIIISSFLVTLASLLKPMFLAIVVFGSLLINHFNSNRNIKIRILLLTLYNTFPFFFTILYFRWSYINLGYILSTLSNNYFDYNLFNYFSKILYYLGINYIFILPFSISDFTYQVLKKYKFYFLCLLILFLFGYLNTYFPGELDLGNFFNINKNILKGFYFLFAGLMLFHFHLSLKKSNYNKIYAYAIIAFLCYIMALSFFRPTQRYLMLFIPILYSVNFFLRKKNYKLYYVFFAIFILINICLTTYSHYRSKNAYKVIKYLKNKLITEVTAPGPLNDSYNFYIYDNIKKKYQITSVKPETYIKEFSSGFLFFKTHYYLSKI